jgi:hypothetical protein
MGLRNVIEHGLRASHSPALIEQRKEQVQLLQPVSKRLAVQAIDGVVFSLANVRNYVADRDARAAGLEKVGAGVEADVYRMGDSAIKYVRNSHLLSDSGRRELVDIKQSDFLKLQAELAIFMPAQTITIEPHLFNPGREVVQTTQPFVRFEPLVTYRGVERSVVLPNKITPLIADDLSDFLDGAWTSFGKEKILPDTNGSNNLVIDSEGRLKLLDTQPVGTMHPEVQVKIMEQMRSLALQLNKTAD